MRLGIHLPQIGRKAGPNAIRRAAEQAEQLGFADVWTSEHIILPDGAPYPPSPLISATNPDHIQPWWPCPHAFAE